MASSACSMARKRIAGLIVLMALLDAGCVAAAARSPRSSRPTHDAFVWLHPAPPPEGWSRVRLNSGTSLALPPGWRRIPADRGTASAARVDARSGLIVEYLNATPQQGSETLRNWARFRPDHNLDEGDRHEQVLAAAQGLTFRDGTGSCVIDRYHTSRTSYQEIACLVRRSGRGSVIVAAALTAGWAQAAPVLERAVSAFMA